MCAAADLESLLEFFGCRLARRYFWRRKAFLQDGNLASRLEMGGSDSRLALFDAKIPVRLKREHIL